MSEYDASSPAPTDADMEARLARLSQASEAIEPSADFKLAILSAIADESEGEQVSVDTRPKRSARAQAAPSWLDGVAKKGRFAFPAAAAAAALALWWSAQVQQDFDEDVLASYDVVEVVE